MEQALLSSIDEYNERENEKERKKERRECSKIKME